METNEKDTSALPPGKDDWIRFGTLEAQAKSKKIWQVVALIAIARSQSVAFRVAVRNSDCNAGT